MLLWYLTILRPPFLRRKIINSTHPRRRRRIHTNLFSLKNALIHNNAIELNITPSVVAKRARHLPTPAILTWRVRKLAVVVAAWSCGGRT